MRAEGCDLGALPLRVVGPDGNESLHELTIAADGEGHTADIALRIPRRVGEHAWRVSLTSPEAAGIRHEPDALTISLHARAHDTSLAVWDIPSPVVTGERLTIKVGAKSSSACELSGRNVEVCDDEGAVVARAALNATPWPGTDALYWTELEFFAPVRTGMCTRTVPFRPGRA